LNRQKIKEHLPPEVLTLVRILMGLVPELFPAQHHERNWGGRYYYAVWLRHLLMARRHGFKIIPRVVAELGPGGSLGTGLAALLSGAESYQALDVVNLFEAAPNLKILAELEELFRARAPIPDEREFPQLKPRLESYEFPRDVLTDGHLKKTLDKERLAAIRQALLHPGPHQALLSYYSPYDLQTLAAGSVDLLLSQAVLEHVDDLPRAYEAMRLWLKPGGLLSHTIDFKAHGTAEAWNGHWGYSDLVWRLMRGRKPYLINRRPHSTHLELLKKNGFALGCDLKEQDASGLSREQLAPRFQNLSDDDLLTSGAFIQAVKSN
jgi:SAM-dependent methyltransferase